LGNSKDNKDNLQHVSRSHEKDLDVEFGQVNVGDIQLGVAPKLYACTPCGILRRSNQPRLEASNDPHVRGLAPLVYMPVSVRSAGRSKAKANVSNGKGFEASSLAVCPLKRSGVGREIGVDGKSLVVLRK
jgi:hypothetical protein